MSMGMGMRAMRANEIREIFIEFFAERGHAVVPSASLVPAGDPSLLFTNAGMVPFKDVFLGREERPYRSATSAQKVLRVSGKHNDLEEVGRSPRHHTFFEMLGNFSFGGYYKQEAIRLAWDLLTKVYAIPVERLWFTVFAGDERLSADDEAARAWEAVGADPSRVLRFGAKENFWAMGDSGPCGPNSEIHVYIGDDLGAMRAEGVNSDDPNYVEIWNLVFMQFDRATMEPLPRPAIDTGMSLERLALVLQRVPTTYDTDLFRPLIERIVALAGREGAGDREGQVAERVIADHARACAFLIADGVLPASEGRGYVLRRLIRRAAYYGRRLGLDRPFLFEVAAEVVEIMGAAYPELEARRQVILTTIAAEEERFGQTLRAGLALLERQLQELAPTAPLPGAVAFALHDTHGFPLDLTEKIAAEQGRSVDTAGFARAMAEQRRRSRAARATSDDSEAGPWDSLALKPTEFTGYDRLGDRGRVLALLVEGQAAEEATEGATIQLALERTPFYAEGGGQVGDTGLIVGPAGEAHVEDTRRPLPGLIVHYGTVTRGVVRAGDQVEARVDAARRLDTMRNHTATHLLHRALRDLLGEQATQAGSLVEPERLRFDFHQPRPLTAEQQATLARSVNAWIRADLPVRWEFTSHAEALERGATALFGEKYGERVRLVSIGCDEGAEICSRELCGGMHVGRTGEIGTFRIVGESGVAGGVRRIEALTGRAADESDESRSDLLHSLAARLSAPPSELPARVDRLLAELRRAEEERDRLRGAVLAQRAATLMTDAEQIDGMRLLAARVEVDDGAELTRLGDLLRDRLDSGVVALGTVTEGLPRLLVQVTPDLAASGYHAGRIIETLAQALGAHGGGSATIAQAGGGDPGRLDAALAGIRDSLSEGRAHAMRPYKDTRSVEDQTHPGRRTM